MLSVLHVPMQNLLNRLLTVDLPALMVLPERLEISVPPSVTSIAEAAVGRDTIMRAVASAVLQVCRRVVTAGSLLLVCGISMAWVAVALQRSGLHADQLAGSFTQRPAV